ncbi:MAG: hypothetical protein ACM3IJ_04625 [Candidatus Levyibacteriota bacterium]
MVDTVGDRRPSFKMENARDISSPRKPRFSEKAKLTVAAFIAALGIGGVKVASGPIGDAAGTIDSAASHITQIGLTTQQEADTNALAESLASEGHKFGDPRPEAIATDPNTGRDGIVYRGGSIGEIPISGNITTKAEYQAPIFHLEPRVDGSVMSQQDVEKLGIKLDDLKMVEVYGGLYDQDGKKEWVKVTGTNKEGRDVNVFVAEKFVKFNKQDELRIKADNKLITLPYTMVKPEIQAAVPQK